MNWTQDKSVTLSRICVIFFFFLWIGVCVSGPWLFRFYVNLRGEVLEGAYPFLLATLYTMSVPVLLVLYHLWRFLTNIRGGNVFILENVQRLRILSWGCLAGAVILFISGFYYIAFFALAVLAGFMTIILRIVKNAFAEAVMIKTENDYTI